MRYFFEKKKIFDGGGEGAVINHIKFSRCLDYKNPIWVLKDYYHWGQVKTIFIKVILGKLSELTNRFF